MDALALIAKIFKLSQCRPLAHQDLHGPDDADDRL
jgi:hypothetical protein